MACNTPITLTSGQEYRAVKTINKSNVSSTTYSHTANFFSTGSGNPGAVNGPLTIFAAPGGTTPEPSGDGQMVFSISDPSTDVTDPLGIRRVRLAQAGMAWMFRSVIFQLVSG